MKKLTLLSLVLVAGITLSGCLFSKQATTTPAPEAAAPTNESFSGTMGELLAKGKSVKCTSASEEAGTKTENEFYIDSASGRSRNIIKMTAANKPAQTTNSITTKEAVYTWVEGQKEGFLFPVTKTEPTASQPAATEQNAPAAPTGAKPDEKYNFNCAAWQVDESIFALPKDVTFVDQAAKLKDLLKNLPAVK